MTRFHPSGDDVQGIPQGLTKDYGSGGSRHDTDDGADGEDGGEEGQLDELSPAFFGVTGEIGDVTGECCPGTCDRRHGAQEKVCPCTSSNCGFHREDLTRSSGFVDTPSHGRESCDRGGEHLNEEEISETCRRDQEKRQLDNPEEEVTEDELVPSKYEVGLKKLT